jgi:hypothetical protein
MSDLSKKKKDIRFPLLFEASEKNQDEFWKNFLLDLARGRFPKKITVDCKSIHAGTKRNQLTYFYANKSAEDIAKDIPIILRKHLSVYSQTDIQEQTHVTEDHFNEFVNRIQDNCWKRIKSKKMKQSLLVDYTLRCKNEWNLNWNQARELHRILDDAFFVYRTHVNNDIQMEEGEITNIEDIRLVNGNIVNTRYNDQLEETEEETEEEKISSVNDIWCQYIRTLADEL